MAGLYVPDPYAPVARSEPDPYAMVPGIEQMGPTAADMVALGESLVGPGPAYQPSRASRGPTIAFSPTAQQLYVNGFQFGSDDAQRALESERYLGADPTELPAGDWVALDEQAYGAYLNSIKNPSLGRLAKKNFGRGVDINQMLAGRFLQFAGAEQTGQKIVANQLEDLRKTSPFDRQFTDIGEQENRGILDWFVANLAQQGPNIVESALTALAGAGAGAIAGGGANPFTAAGGALMSLAGKQTFKQSVLAAARKHAAGQTLTAAEIKLLREAAGITAQAKIQLSKAKGLVPYNPQVAALGKAGQQAQMANAAATRAAGKDRLAGLLTGATPINAPVSQAMVGGAGIASIGQNYLTGVADVYGETIESGDEDRAIAAAMGIPYALLETAPEFILAGRVFGNLGGRSKVFGTTPLSELSGKGAKAGELLKRGAVGFTVGGIGEGLTEAGQEGLLLGVNDQVDWDSPEGMNRLINSFAAGFGVGGPIGGVGGLFGTDGKSPGNLLNPGQSTEPSSAIVPVVPPAAPPGPAGLEGELMPPPGVPPQLPGPAGATFPVPMGLGPQSGSAPGTILTGEGEIPTGPGTQGVLPLFDEMPASEMAARMGGVPALPAALPPGSGGQPTSNTFTNPQQGALQFAPEAPTTGQPTTALGLALQQAIDRERRGTEFDQAAAQREQQTQAQRDADYERALAQRELQAAQQAETGQPLLSGFPMRQAGQPTPQQLPLFKRGQTPRPSRSELLRRGMAPVTPTATRPAVDLEPTDNVQLEMFNNAGQPTVAALKGAGLRRKARPVPAGTGVKQAPPTGKKVTREDIAAARAGAEEKAGPKRGLKKQAGVAKVEKANAVQERSPTQVDAREQAGTGKGMGGEVAPAVKTARAGGDLRKGKAQQSGQARQQAKAVFPVLNELRDRYEELSISPDSTKAQAVALGQRMLKAGLLIDKDMTEIRRIAGDRDMTVEDVLAELKFYLDRGEDILAEAEYQQAVKPKEEPPVPKTEAAAAVSAAAAQPQTPAQATSEKVEAKPTGPVAIEVELADGRIMRVPDGKKMLEKLDQDIEKFERFLACLMGK